MEYSRTPKCFLIIPRHFYSFEKQFKENLEGRGYEVTVSNDEYPSNNFGKILGKLNIPILLPWTEWKISKNYLSGRYYDLVLIFKGRGISASLIKKITLSSKKVVGYNWDSFKYNKAPLKWYKYATNYYTFDYRDADKYNIPVVELFSSIKEQNNNVRKDIVVSAIFRNHSGRLQYLDKILNILKEPNPYIFIYEQNIFFFIKNFLKNPLRYLKYKRYISFKSLTYNEYINILEKSKITIDYAHPDQSGLTMRCFEALSTNTKIITNNDYVTRSNYFNLSNAKVFKENEKNQRVLEGLRNFANTTNSHASRSLNDFMDDLLK